MKENTLSDRIINFMTGFQLPDRLPAGVGVLEPWRSDEVISVATKFYSKFYSDRQKRFVMVGINPGRFGGGQTGIPFTDPIRLLKECGIPNSFNQRPELSSEFIYRIINSFGGPEIFYQKFYMTSVCPVGFTFKEKNLNYYDLPSLQSKIEKWAPGWMNTQIEFGLSMDICFCIGEGKNFEFLQKLNQENNWFKSIVALPHPRFIMQYRRKQLEDYIRRYLEALKSI